MQNKDSRKLVNIYLKLKEDEVDLLEMELKHPQHKEFKDIILKCVEELDKVAHLLVAEASQIKDDRPSIDRSKEPKDIWNDNSPNGPWGE